MTVPTLLSAADIRSVASWPLLVDAIRAGHKRPKASVGDSFVGGSGNTMLVRSAWIDGLAAGAKAATVVPKNLDRAEPLPSIHAQVLLFSHETGQLTATLDGTEVTRWKTAADSALGSELLSREDSHTLLMVGAGAMAEPLVRAHSSVRPSIDRVLLWNRTAQKAQYLAQQLSDLDCRIEVVDDLSAATGEADIVCCATMSSDPVLSGADLKPGCHVDLVGAYKANMREADDAVHERGRWFVDSRDTTICHIGELMIPIAEGTITADAVIGDLHDLVDGRSGRESDEDITVFKNGGGAHLDIMVSQALLEAYAAAHT